MNLLSISKEESCSNAKKSWWASILATKILVQLEARTSHRLHEKPHKAAWKRSGNLDFPTLSRKSQGSKRVWHVWLKRPPLLSRSAKNEEFSTTAQSHILFRWGERLNEGVSNRSGPFFSKTWTLSEAKIQQNVQSLIKSDKRKGGKPMCSVRIIILHEIWKHVSRTEILFIFSEILCACRPTKYSG